MPSPTSATQGQVSWHTRYSLLLRRSATGEPVVREWLATSAVGLLMGLFCALLLLDDPGWFHRGDNQLLCYPVLTDIARAWKEGSFPLLSPYSWHGGAIAGELEHGIFSPFITLSAVVLSALGLSIPLKAGLHAGLHLAVLAMGVYRLGRWRKLPRSLAVLAAFITSTSGFIMVWAAACWLPVLTSFVWVPWLWLALERSLVSRKSALTRVAPGVVFLYLLITAGWPMSNVMAGLITAWLGLRTWAERRHVLAPWPLAVIWGLGLALAAPTLLIFLENMRESGRAIGALSLDWKLSVPFKAFLGLAFPSYSCVWEPYFFGEAMRKLNLEMTGGLVSCGLVPVVLLSRAGRAALWKYRWEAALCLLSVGLAVGPAVKGLRNPFRWLPLFFLVLGLLSALLLQALRRQEQTEEEGAETSPRAGRALWRNPALWAGILVLIVGGYAVYRRIDSTWRTPVQLVLFALVCLGWGMVEALASVRSGWRAWAPAAVVLLSSLVIYVGVGMFLPYLSWGRLAEKAEEQDVYSPGVRYLTFYTWGEVWRFDPQAHPPRSFGCGEHFLPGNTQMHLGVETVNGYSVIFPRGLVEVTGMWFAGSTEDRSLVNMPPEVMMRRESGPEGLLALMGVDGVVLSPRWSGGGPDFLASGWELGHSSDAARTYHRVTPSNEGAITLPVAVMTGSRDEAVEHLRARKKAGEPWCLVADSAPATPSQVSLAPTRVQVRNTSRLSVEVEVHNPDTHREGLVVFQRPWYPGYQAWLDGQPLPVDRAALILPAVRIPPGASGRLILRYWPRSLSLGLALASGALGVLVVLGFLHLAGRPRRGERATELCP